jgi:hypothetical protein
MILFEHYQRIKQNMRPDIHYRIAKAVPAFKRRAAHVHIPSVLHDVAVREVEVIFGHLPTDQSNLLAFYLIGEALRDSLDSLSDMSEMESLRLQMTMDRRSKFIQTLSNLEKQIEDTDESIAESIK